MSETFRNIGLFLLLMSVCFLIKCKVDSDKLVLDKETSERVSLVDEKSKEEAREKEALKKLESDKKIEAEKQEQIAKEEKKATERLAEKKDEATKVEKAKAKTKKKTIKPKIKRQAKIEFEELSWDMGELVAGDIRKKKFKFTNTGNAPLQIIGATATCGCATPTVPFLDIAPGESNTIGVQYNSVSKEGDQFPEVTIESNTKPKYTVLKLSAKVTPKPKDESKVDESKQDSTSRQ